MKCLYITSPLFNKTERIEKEKNCEHNHVEFKFCPDCGVETFSDVVFVSYTSIYPELSFCNIRNNVGIIIYDGESFKIEGNGCSVAVSDKWIITLDCMFNYCMYCDHCSNPRLEKQQKMIEYLEGEIVERTRWEPFGSYYDDGY